jgi:hypothetical protein
MQNLSEPICSSKDASIAHLRQPALLVGRADGPNLASDIPHLSMGVRMFVF